MSKSDPYLSDDFAIKRLTEEWRKYGKIVIAYDYDDTVFDFHKKGYKYDRVVELLRRCKEFGAYFIVHTACGPDQEDNIRKYLTDNNIPFDSINENCPFVPKTTGRKCYFNVLLDDRAGLSSAYNTLKASLNNVQITEEETHD